MADSLSIEMNDQSSSTTLGGGKLVKSKSQMSLRRSLTISFKDLSYSVMVKKKKMQILKGVSGTVTPGELVAVFGPSGSGKTTLLDILANRKESGEITGSVLINGQEIDDDYKRLCSYVVQEDILLPTITVRETLRFYADLKLPPSWTNKEKVERIDQILEQIGLKHRADSKIGGILPGGIILRGLSGGEKRRVTIGCGLITSPSIILLDEPTSGLDSSSAKTVMDTLQELSQTKNVTVICTIHQPRSEIFKMFTKCMVLTEGRLVYYGNKPVEHFSSLGYPFPDLTNPADYILDSVTQIKEEGRADEIGDKLSETYLQQASSEASVQLTDSTLLYHTSTKKKKISAYNNGLWTQFIVLWKRTGLDFMRNPSNCLIRFAVAIFVGLLFGACFANLGLDEKGVQSRAAVLFYLVINMILQPFASLSLFISKRTLFNAERASRLYHTFPYYCAMMFFEILACIGTAFILGTISYWFSDLNNGVDNYFFAMCILTLAHFAGDFFMLFISCITVQVDTSFAVGAGVATIYQLFAGFFVHIDKLPISFRWLHWCNFVYYSFEALMANEFIGETIIINGKEESGRIVLDQFGLNQRKGINLIIVSSFAILFFFMVYFVLHYFHREKR
ncbi:ABC transporter G family protein [Dictyostelium purpureum]|uniref:ABC transporter G family protein n=1 Tax=Dictyostelium purpureum TaxID=5786 RepID=F0Z6T2_DICPU|nr:ABC transporter G family protein [Dictyostelium purpureum]EGC40363.1 ABC transporter G family protein [Dictyostelium purpureum]|eukprot:XP_003283114.1 ABC transporter G family protein [Dictyostelium purpureum]